MASVRKLLTAGLGTALMAGLGLTACQSYELQQVEPKAFAAVKKETPIAGKALKPYIMLVVDVSGSMKDPASDSSSATKWDGLLRAFADSSSGFLPKSRDMAHFGLTIFPSPSETDGCLPGVVNVPINAENNNVDTVMGKLTGTVPAGGTPISLTLQEVLTDPLMVRPEEDDGRLRFAMLLTDGLPNCNPSPANAARCDACNQDSASCQDQANNGCMPTYGEANTCDIYAAPAGSACLDENETVQAVAALRDSGIDTFVIGFGKETALGTAGSRVLNSAAAAGGRGRTGEVKYYQAGNEAELTNILEEIINVVQSCDFGLDPAPSSEGVLQVIVYDRKEEKEISLQRGSDWNFASDTREAVTLGDNWCSTLQNAPPNRYELRFSYATNL